MKEIEICKEYMSIRKVKVVYGEQAVCQYLDLGWVLLYLDGKEQCYTIGWNKKEEVLPVYPEPANGKNNLDENELAKRYLENSDISYDS